MAYNKEYFKQWREKNRDKVNERQRKWQQENKEKIKEYQKNYLSKYGVLEKRNENKRKNYAKNIDKHREQARIRQARFRERQKALKENRNEI